MAEARLGSKIPTQDLPLQDRVAIVTGASRGIGRAIAVHLASLGAKVVINYTSNSSQADLVASGIYRCKSQYLRSGASEVPLRRRGVNVQFAGTHRGEFRRDLGSKVPNRFQHRNRRFRRNLQRQHARRISVLQGGGEQS